MASILPQPGEVVGQKYRIERKIGEGGMGSVYQAVDTTLGRHVAIKVLDPKMASDPHLHQRFEREARVARHLQHPNTIQIFDYGQTQYGVPFIVMEFLRGRTVDDIIRTEGAISVPRTLAMVRQILASLAEAHQAGVIHRDLKPSNVIVGEFGGETDFVKVLDFGIAKLLDAERDSGALKTRSGMVIGSPAYMAPERIKSLNLSPASDLYSLGIMMVEMISGQMMFTNKTPVEVIAYRLGGNPLPIPDWIKTSPVGPIIDRSTCYEEGERFQSALEMMQVIDQAATGGVSGSGTQPAWGFDALEKTLKMDSSRMDLSKPLPHRPNPVQPVPGPGYYEEPSMWSNPANIVMVVLIVLLVIATGIILTVALL